MRTAIASNTQFSLSLWTLKLDSELLFIGDAGTTQASRASERRGIEAAVIWNPLSWLILDADLAWSHSRFSDFDPAGDRIRGAVENVASIGVAIDHPRGWFAGARFRHFGEAALIENNRVRSEPTTLVNIETGYRFWKRYNLSAAVYNVFDSDDNDITYFYESRLAGETAPVVAVIDRSSKYVADASICITLLKSERVQRAQGNLPVDLRFPDLENVLQNRDCL